MVTTGAPLTGWGAILDGRPARGDIFGHLLQHKNCLEMKVVYLALRYFHPDLRCYHVLVLTGLLHKSLEQTAFSPPFQVEFN